MKLKFIESSRYLLDGTLLKTRRLFFPAITFPYLAALTPRDIEISMTHEILEDIDFEERVDLVGLTSITNNVLRAYEIADEYRKRKVPVAMGGFHASAQPDEALEHADFVFVGEAEDTWPQFLQDFKNGNPKRLYEAPRSPSLEKLPIPRYDIIKKANYVGYANKSLMRHILKPLIPIQSARGCTARCDFCDVTHFHKGTYRVRPVPDVVGEIKTLQARFVCFVDDNIFANYARAKDLFKALIPLKIKWIGQGTISAAEDKELLSLAKKSGCIGLLVGLETISQLSLSSVGKKENKVNRYERNLKAYKNMGIDIDASMTFGFEGEDPSVFKNTLDFLMKNRVPFAGLQPLRPSPTTSLYDKLKSQGRLKKEKWWLDRESVARVYDLKFTGAKIPDDDFAKNLYSMYKNFYSWRNIVLRFLWPPQSRFLRNIILTAKMRKKISPQAFISEY